MTEFSTQDRTTLRRFLEERFVLSELKVLAFDVGVDYEMFPHDTKPDFVRGLIGYLERRDELRSLVQRVIEERPDDDLAHLLARLSDKSGLQKVQIILSNDKIKSKPDLRQKLAELLGISTEEVMLIATAAGSIKLLVGLPPEAAERLTRLELPHLFDEYEIIEVTLYPRLPKTTREFWRQLVVEAIAGSAGVAGAAGASGLTFGKMVIWIIAILATALLLVGGGAAIWYQGLPDMTVVNNCGSTLPLTSIPPAARRLLNLPEAFDQGESIEFPLVSGRGRYRLEVEGRPPQVILYLPRALPIVNTDRLTLGPADDDERFRLNGQLVRIPSEFRLGRNEQVELVLCAGR